MIRSIGPTGRQLFSTNPRFGALIQVHYTEKSKMNGNPLEDQWLRQTLIRQLQQNEMAVDIFTLQTPNKAEMVILTGAENHHMNTMAPWSAKAEVRQKALNDIWTLAPENRRMKLQINPLADTPITLQHLDRIRGIDAHPQDYPSPYRRDNSFKKPLAEEGIGQLSTSTSSVLSAFA